MGPALSPRLRAAAWAAVLAVWTLLLLAPNPLKPVRDSIPDEHHFTLAKLLHVFAYAGLGVAAAWAFHSPAARRAAWAGLVAHGVLTELGQQFVPSRQGSVRDALLDAGGVLLAVLAVRLAERARGPGAGE